MVAGGVGAAAAVDGVVDVVVVAADVDDGVSDDVGMCHVVAGVDVGCAYEVGVGVVADVVVEVVGARVAVAVVISADAAAVVGVADAVVGESDVYDDDEVGVGAATVVGVCVHGVVVDVVDVDVIVYGVASCGVADDVACDAAGDDDDGVGVCDAADVGDDV